MAEQRKRESSYASTRLTHSNYRGGPPLTRINGQRIAHNSRQVEEQAPKLKEKPVYEPATDDEPERSTEEEDVGGDISDGDFGDYAGDMRSLHMSGLSMRERIEADNEAAERNREGASQQRNGNAAGRKRANGSDDAGNDEEEMFPGLSQSQRSKRQKSRTYGSKQNFNTTTSSTPASGDPMSIPNSQRDAKAEEQSTENKEEVGFKFPMDIDLGSPPPRTKARSKTKSKRDVKVNGASPKATHPNDTISSSSLAASSGKNDWLFETDGSSLSTPLSSADSSFILELSQVDARLKSVADSEDEPQPIQSLCPVCNEEVDPELLQAFRSKPRQRIRDQMRFCESHQQTTAEKQWRERGYPTIDWNNFDERIQAHFADIEQLLVPDSPSYYHNVLVSALKSGKARNFRLTLAGDALETISCGYYGTRGATVMYVFLHLFLEYLLTRSRLQALTIRFSHKIRRQAARDQIINKAGVVGYTQSVLVPELAMRLVKEDMGVGDDTARQIMRDSINIGEALNADPNDVVPVPAEEASVD